MGPWSPAEKKAALLIALAVVLWMTDFWHHISPAMIGLGVGLLAAFPGIGVLETEDVKKLNYLPIFFTAAAICMGNVLMATKTLDFLTGEIVAWLHPLVVNPFTASLVLYWSGCVYHVFLGDEVGMLSTSMPILMKFAHTHGMNPLFAGMVWTLSAGGRIFVYQSAVLVVGYSYGSFTARDMFRMGVFLTVVESILLMVFAPLYWPREYRRCAWRSFRWQKERAIQSGALEHTRPPAMDRTRPVRAQHEARHLTSARAVWRAMTTGARCPARALCGSPPRR